jgi:hypothetical protein
MNITLGVFDLFTYTVPGALYLALVTYIAERLSWINPLQLLQTNTTVVVISAAILSYIIGHVTNHVGYIFSRVYGRDKNGTDAIHEFTEGVPAAQGRPFLQAPQSVLQAAVEIHAMEAAIEISRLQAVGLMLRNCAPVFVLGAIVEIADAAAGAHAIVALCCIVIFPLVAIGCLSRSIVWRHWADAKTLELAYWIPNIDDSFLGNSPVRQAKQPDQSSSKQETRNQTSSTSRRSKRPANQSPAQTPQ